MKREKIFTYIGLTLLLACFTIALVRVFSRERAARDESVQVIRFAHWQLESGIREAIDVLIKDYEALHPDVRVEQIAVPERTYKQWVRTQLIGGTASDIVQLGQGTDDELAARFLIPISQIVEEPNPYNAGTDLAATPWRETFVDGMMGGLSFRPNLLEYYGIPLSMFTVRVYYNQTLWNRILGDTPVPEDFDAFMKICEAVRAHADSTGRPIIPIAGSKANGPMLIDKFFASQTQRLLQEIDLLANLRPSAPDIGVGLLRGDWALDSPGYEGALAITREVGLSMQPGYTSLGREDATFYFVQGRALMITTGSWDSPSFRAQAPFEIGVFETPIPARSHPRYGDNVLGRPSEARAGTGLTFGVTRQSPNAERAIDFLHYVTSRTGNATFSKVSGWLPSVVGVEPPAEVVPFLPNLEGYVNGFNDNLLALGANSRRVVEAANNQLVGPAGSIAAYKDAVRQALPDAVREDLERNVRVGLVNISRQDVLAATQMILNQTASADEDALDNARKLSLIREGQSQQEANRAWLQHELRDTAAP